AGFQWILRSKTRRLQRSGSRRLPKMLRTGPMAPETEWRFLKWLDIFGSKRTGATPLRDREPAARASHGESAPMSTLSSSSEPPTNPAALDDAAITQEEVSLHTSLPWEADLLTAEGLRHRAKRAVDVAGAITALVLLWPVMVVVALLIKFTSRGPILFQQARRGYRGRIFNVYKSRTMTVDPEQRLVALESSNESAGGVLFKLRNDPRVTPVGAFLRRSSLDELPQLINVILGDMSLVGPRPLQLRDSDK